MTRRDSWGQRTASVWCAVGLAAAAELASTQNQAAAQESTREYEVERVVDGDTIIVRGVGRIRLIGVDTPETVDPRRPVEFFGREASAFTKRTLEGKRVRLEYDWERTDRYGRTLAYVRLLDGTLINAEIIRQGYGHAYTRFPFKYLEEFRRYEREAREARRGLWGDQAGDLQTASGLPLSVAVWDDNRNGRISCAEARAHGIAPVRRGHPAYPYMRDGDGDGVVCE
ncbi:MAG: nuclease [Acidobacteria bacterium]|nr:nuclease [Acidobacteriota bacterium]MYJ06132.1 nuclease [Acidobacteriota bacterium]